MPQTTLDSKTIDTLRDIPDLIPVYREYYEDWNIRVFDIGVYRILVVVLALLINPISINFSEKIPV